MALQAPGGKGEDFRWLLDLEGRMDSTHFDEVVGNEMTKQMGYPFDLLLGRKTYGEIFTQWVSNLIVLSMKPENMCLTINMDWEESFQIKGDVVI